MRDHLDTIKRKIYKIHLYSEALDDHDHDLRQMWQPHDLTLLIRDRVNEIEDIIERLYSGIPLDTND